MIVTYIKLNTEEKFISFDKSLPTSLYKNIGSTYEDYLEDKWVRLTPPQVSYKKNHPEATVWEVFHMKSYNTEKSLSLEEIKTQKINEILAYDKSREIQVFYINSVPDWWDKNKRMSIFYRLENEKKLNRTETTLWFREFKVVTTLSRAYEFLMKLEGYAIDCLDNTNNHIEAVKALTSPAAVSNYNYKIGYPVQINVTYTC